MSQRISSSFPGGPGKRAAPPPADFSERLKRVEEIEGRIAERRLHLRRRARLHRLKTGLLAATILAVGAGLYVGLHDGAGSTRPEASRVEQAEGAGERLPTTRGVDFDGGGDPSGSSTSNR